ncbi:hypothetical protein ACFZDB_28095 [Streptomyces luteogriseus]|nr:hypothetical protein [Streptomyces sp. NRRL S-475]
MSRGWDWESGEGLLRLDDPGEWDAAFESYVRSALESDGEDWYR